MAYTDILGGEPLYLQALRASKQIPQDELTPEQEEEQTLLGSIGSGIADVGLGALNTIGTVLDTPASFLRGLASGNVGRAFTGVFNPEDRVSGKELVGIEDNPDSWWDDIGGIGVEIVTDPLFWLTGATKAGKFLKGTGKAGAVERGVGGALLKGKRVSGMDSTIRKAAAELGDEAVVEAARAYKPGYVDQILNKFGVGKYGDEFADEVAAGLKQAPGAGGVVDEPARHALPGFSYFTDTTKPLLDKAASKLTGKTPREIAEYLDVLGERIRFGDWLPKKAPVVASQAVDAVSPVPSPVAAGNAVDAASEAIPLPDLTTPPKAPASPVAPVAVAGMSDENLQAIVSQYEKLQADFAASVKGSPESNAIKQQLDVFDQVFDTIKKQSAPPAPPAAVVPPAATVPPPVPAAIARPIAPAAPIDAAARVKGGDVSDIVDEVAPDVVPPPAVVDEVPPPVTPPAVDPIPPPLAQASDVVPPPAAVALTGPAADIAAIEKRLIDIDNEAEKYYEVMQELSTEIYDDLGNVIDKKKLKLFKDAEKAKDKLFKEGDKLDAKLSKLKEAQANPPKAKKGKAVAGPLPGSAPKNVLPGVKVADEVADEIPVVANAPDYITNREGLARRIDDLAADEKKLVAELGNPKTTPERAMEIEQGLAAMKLELESLSKQITEARAPNPGPGAPNIQTLTDELNAPGTTPARAEELRAAIQAVETNALGKPEEIAKSVSATGPELAMDAALPPAPPAKIGSMASRVKDVLSKKAELPGATQVNPLGAATTPPASAAPPVPPAAATPTPAGGGAGVPPKVPGTSIPPGPAPQPPRTPGALPKTMVDPDKDEGFNLIRYFASLFQRMSRGSSKSYGQKLAHLADARETTAGQMARKAVDDHRMKIVREVPKAERESVQFQHEIVDLVETGKIGPLVGQYPSVLAFAADAENLTKAAITGMIHAGVPIDELKDRAVKFLYRDLNILPDSKLSKGLGAIKQVSTATKNMEGRLPIFRHMATTWFNDFLSHDTRFATEDLAKGWRDWLDAEVAAGRRTAADADTLFNTMSQGGEAAFRQQSINTLLYEQKYQQYDGVKFAALSKEIEVLDAAIKTAEANKTLGTFTASNAKDLAELYKKRFKAIEELKPHQEAVANAAELVDWMKNNVGDEYIKYSATSGKRVGLFTADAIGGLEKYLTNSGRSEVVAKSLIEHLGQFVSTQGGPGTMPLGQALERMTLGRNKVGTEEAYARLRDLLGLAEDYDFGGATVPKSVVDEFTRTVGRVEGLPEAKGIVGLYDKAMTLFKSYALMRPAFHFRNKFSGTIQNLMFLSHSLDGERMARDLRAGKTINGASSWPAFVGKNMDDAQATDELRKMMHIYDVVPENAGLAGDVVSRWDAKNTQAIPGLEPQELRSPLKYIKDAWKSTKDALRSKEPFWSRESQLNPLNIGSIRGEGAETRFLPSVGHEGLGNTVEFQNRGVPFLLGMQQGMDPAVLAQKIKDTHVDYRNLSQFEREYMRRIAPFYSYTRGMLPFTAKQLVENPGGTMAQTVRATNVIRGDEPMPDHLKQTLSIPLGRDEQGTQSYLHGLGLMPEDSLSIIGSGLSTLGGGRGITQELSGMLSPFFKAPIEQATGRTLYQTGPGGGRELRDMDPVLGRIGANLFGGDPLKTHGVDPFLMNSIPSQASLVKNVTDPRKPLFNRMLDVVTGAKIASVPVKTQEAMVRQSVQELMREVGGRGYEKYYIPKDVYAKLSPEEQKRADMLNKILSDLANRAKARAKMVKEPSA